MHDSGIEIVPAHPLQAAEIAALMTASCLEPKTRCMHCDLEDEVNAKSLRNLAPPMEQTCVVARKNREIHAMVALDCDLESKRGWILGPFSRNPESIPLRRRVVDQLLAQTPSGLERIDAFTDRTNNENRQIYADLGFRTENEVYLFRADNPGVRPAGAKRCRTLEPRDHEAFVALHDREFPGTYFPGARIPTLIGPDHQVFVIGDPGSIEGYVHAGINEDPNEGYVHFLAVDAASRRGGLGRRLLVSALDWLFFERGFLAVYLTVNSDRIHAQALYRSAGFDLENVGIHQRLDL